MLAIIVLLCLLSHVAPQDDSGGYTSPDTGPSKGNCKIRPFQFYISTIDAGCPDKGIEYESEELGRPYISVELMESDGSEDDKYMKTDCDLGCLVSGDSNDGLFDNTQEWYLKILRGCPPHLDHEYYCAMLYEEDPMRYKIPGLHGTYNISLDFKENKFMLTPYGNHFPFPLCSKIEEIKKLKREEYETYPNIGR